jgi:hypothetical protein
MPVALADSSPQPALPALRIQGVTVVTTSALAMIMTRCANSPFVIYSSRAQTTGGSRISIGRKTVKR